jgi:hypothetical protein
LCLFADDGTETKLPVTARTGDVWHAYVPGVGAGQRYGYRVNGPWNPGAGLWANEAKLLLDPWSKAIDGGYDGDSSACAHLPTDRTKPDPRDSAPHTPRSVVVDPSLRMLSVVKLCREASPSGAPRRRRRCDLGTSRRAAEFSAPVLAMPFSLLCSKGLPTFSALGSVRPMPVGPLNADRQ